MGPGHARALARASARACARARAIARAIARACGISSSDTFLRVCKFRKLVFAYKL